MTNEDIQDLVERGSFPDSCKSPDLVETHISWVVLTDDFAFKIKKPLRLNFLDFSTLALRKLYCEEELRLNRRLADIYQAVVPIVKKNGKFHIGGPGRAVDYAVQMKRLPPDKQMHHLLEKGKVKEKDIVALGEMMARFHQQARIVKKPFDAQAAKDDFADLSSVVPILEKYVDKKYGQWAMDWINGAADTIEKYENRLAERAEEGFVRDGHGDLHSGNIFLLDQPIIFDCIEFNEHLRINDVLSELAFLAMDLERNRRSDLKTILITTYRKAFPCFLKAADEAIFQYFLLYRASVRLKISAIKLGEEKREGEGVNNKLMAEIQALIDLCKIYHQRLKEL